MTHRELIDSLAAHLRSNTDRVVWCDMQLGPSGSPRPDVYTIRKSYAHFSADAYEIKASASDLRGDVTSGKWQKYLRYAHRVWFAFPRGMVKLEDIPRECGIILHSANGWRAQRKPVARSMDTLPHEAWMKLLIDGDRYSLAPQAHAKQFTEWSTEQAIKEKIGQEVAQILKDRRAAEHSYERATEHLKRESIRLSDEADELYEQRHRAAERIAFSLNAAHKGLLEAVGLPETATHQELRAKLHELAHAFDDRHSIKSVVSSLQALQSLCVPEAA